MIKKIIFAYHIKPGFLGTASIIKNVALVVATSGLMQEASALTLAGVQSLPINILGRSAMQGLSSAFLTVRVGLICQNSCRPISLDKNRYGKLMGTLFNNVQNKIKKLISKI